MPLYEYYCADCNGIFELLRPVREASFAQPCPVCDADARRMMPTDFAAFVVREGLPRRIPDTGKYWTRWGLADQAETGDASDPVPTYGAPPGDAITSEDDDKQEIRIRLMQEEQRIAQDTGRIPEIDMQIATESSEYRRRAELRRRRKRAVNEELTPRTRTGTHTPASLQRKRDAK